MRFRRVGGREVSAIGLGAMPLSLPGRPERGQAIATIHAALDAGITLIDTADAYTTNDDQQGHNEELVAEALADRADASAVLVATKGGLIYRTDGPWDGAGSPAHLKQAAHNSRRRLRVETIGLYQLHRHDPKVDYADSIGAIAELIDEGVVRMAGVSNASIAQIQVARGILGERLVSVQNRFSADFTSSLAELDFCTQHGIAFLAWAPLGGASRAADAGSRHPAFAAVAQVVGASPQQVMLAWELRLGPTVIPIPGASRPSTIADSAAAADLDLSEQQVQRLNASVAPR